jgi:hypothetical protein
MVPVVVNSHARVNFDGNRYSVPPELARKTALLRAETGVAAADSAGQAATP